MPPINRFALLALLLAAPLGAQQSPAAVDTALARITARGRQLVAQDIALWHGGDALLALRPTAAEVSAVVARLLPNGRWELLAGNLTRGRDTFVVHIRVPQVNADSQFVATRLEVPLRLTGTERDMAVALDVARADFGKVSRPYNSYALPRGLDDVEVYLLPAQTRRDVVPHGGDVRYHLTDGGTRIVTKTPLHRTILDRPTAANAVAMFHTSFDSLPVETDVFLAMRRAPKLAEIVVTERFTYEIQPDGRISRRATVPGSAALPQTTPVRAWVPVIDTVGSAPRIMSPGYTMWRDTTTGWRLIPGRTDTLPAAPNAFEKGYRPILLDDGGMLIVERLPATILLYDSTGRFVRTIGKEGTGPQEFRAEISVAVHHDTVIVSDAYQSRIALFTTRGKFIRTFPTERASAQVGVDDRGRIRVVRMLGFGGVYQQHWLFYSTRGVLLDSLTVPARPEPKSWRLVDGGRSAQMIVPHAPSSAAVFLRDGTLMHGTGDRYEFVVTRTGRDTLRLFGRTNVTAAPLDSFYADTLFRELTGTSGAPDFSTVAKRSDLPTQFPLWNDVTVDDQGYIWVAEGVARRRTQSLAVFAPDGRYLGWVRGWLTSFHATSFQGDRVAFVSYTADRRAVVRHMRIDRRGM
jgi:hypothetical protein